MAKSVAAQAAASPSKMGVTSGFSLPVLDHSLVLATIKCVKPYDPVGARVSYSSVLMSMDAYIQALDSIVICPSYID